MAASLQRDMAAIYRIVTGTPNQHFGTTQTFELLDTVAANFWSLTGREALILQQLAVVAEGTVSLPALTDVTELDEIVYTEAETGLVRHFQVTYVKDRSRQLTQNVAVTEYKQEPQT